MVVLTKQGSRDGFASRLAECVAEHPLAPKDRGKPRWLGHQLKVSGEMARKWLSGEALPNQARMAGIADFFGVRVAWLRDDDGPKRTDGALLDEIVAERIAEPSVTAYNVTVTRSGMLFAAEWEKLPQEGKQIVEELVGIMVGRLKRAERAGTSITTSKGPKPAAATTHPRSRTNQ